ncbi:MAG: hypothetical protein M1144_05025 [Candidatus Thermoplasmatota archaeon]|jgi:hypothetical protein|nr:hypothetical protein [Candidatus Thermoplasmatota archaeon]
MSMAESYPVRKEGTPGFRHLFKRGFHFSRLGGFSSLTSLVIIVLLGFILYTYYHLTFHGLLNGFLHFLW